MELVAIVKRKFYNTYTSRWEYEPNDTEVSFTYNMKTLGVVGSGWKKDCTPEEVADTIKAYFTGTNYVLADIYKRKD
jgi:hypothetical protein